MKVLLDDFVELTDSQCDSDVTLVIKQVSVYVVCLYDELANVRVFYATKLYNYSTTYHAHIGIEIQLTLHTLYTVTLSRNRIACCCLPVIPMYYIMCHHSLVINL